MKQKNDLKPITQNYLRSLQEHLENKIEISEKTLRVDLKLAILAASRDIKEELKLFKSAMLITFDPLLRELE